VSGHVKRPGVYEIEQGVTTFRDLFYGDNFCQGIRDDNELKMFVPGGGSAPWFFPEQLDLPLESRTVGGEGSMLGSGAIIVMDETTDAVKAALRLGAVLRPRVVRQVHPVPRRHHLGGACLAAHPRR
jgi:NADH-quinone oxidoreductase subunit F